MGEGEKECTLSRLQLLERSATELKVVRSGVSAAVQQRVAGHSCSQVLQVSTSQVKVVDGYTSSHQALRSEKLLHLTH